MDLVEAMLNSKPDPYTLSNYGYLHRKVEKELESFTGRPSLPLATGTAALQIAVWLHCKPGTRVAIPDFTHVGTLQAVVNAHCIPVLFPCNKTTWQIDPMALQAEHKAYDAVIVVSPFGYRVETEYYDALMRKMRKQVIYDFAGSWGHFPHTANPVCYSLHATKNLSCGEGGVLAVTSPSLKEMAQRTSNFQNLPDRQIYSPYGNNFKIDEYKAAIILAVLLGSLWRERMENKKETLMHYAKEFAASGLHIPQAATIGFPSLCAFEGFPDARAAEVELVQQGIQARAYYPLLSKMDGLKTLPRVGEGSSAMFETVVALPGDVSPPERDRICLAVQKLVIEQRARAKEMEAAKPSSSPA